MSYEEDEAKIVRATYDLKMKVGGGGFKTDAIQRAEKRLADAKTIFPSAAKHDIDKLDLILDEVRKGNVSADLIEKIKISAQEIRVNGQMFQYPLVSAVAASLYEFCEAIQTLSPITIEVIALHLKTLKIALGEGPRAITPRDRDELFTGLEKASAKALKN